MRVTSRPAALCKRVKFLSDRHLRLPLSNLSDSVTTTRHWHFFAYQNVVSLEHKSLIKNVIVVSPNPWENHSYAETICLLEKRARFCAAARAPCCGGAKQSAAFHSLSGRGSTCCGLRSS